MPLLFIKKLEIQEGLIKEFSVYRIAPNLYEAFAGDTIAILWKEENKWIGETNIANQNLIRQIGELVDMHFLDNIKNTPSTVM